MNERRRAVPDAVFIMQSLRFGPKRKLLKTSHPILVLTQLVMQTRLACFGFSVLGSSTSSLSLIRHSLHPPLVSFRSFWSISHGEKTRKMGFVKKRTLKKTSLFGISPSTCRGYLSCVCAMLKRKVGLAEPGMFI